MKTIVLLFVVAICLIIIFGQCHNNSGHLTYKQAMALRTNYKNADTTTIRKLFGVSAAKRHLNKDSILASVAFSEAEFDILKPFFNDSIPDFSKVEPPKDKFDGYRIHVGIDTTWGVSTEVYILTFGKAKVSNGDTLYLEDKLELGIYRFKNVKLNFDSFPQPHDFLQSSASFKHVLYHLSCNPNCAGDKLK